MMSLAVRRAHAPALLLVAALGLTSCGTEQDTAAETATGSASPSSASAEPSDEPTAEETETIPAGTPACSTVWSDGAELARTYQGCTEGDQYVPRDLLRCSSGQGMVRYADTYYGVLGGTVHEVSGSLDTDDAYRRATHRCRA